MKKMLFAALLAPSIAFAADTPDVSAMRELATGVHLLAGSIQPDRGPDGNTVIFEAPEGLVVIDTGRHAWHSDAILDFARSHGVSIPAIVNTHWHLDHSSGNARIKAEYPNAKLFTSSAIDLALAPDGFLMREYRRLPRGPSLLRLSQVQREEIQIARQTIEHDEFLRPDVPITADGTVRLAGKDFDMHVTKGAVTDADVWLYDPESRIAVLGDLVTFPAPFFETACPKRWREALDDVGAVSFSKAIPGHGTPMSKPQFDTYRQAFNQFVDCAATNTSQNICSQNWVSAVAEFLTDETERDRARRYASYYVSLLRTNNGKSPDCRRE